MALMFVPSESVYAELYDGFDDLVQKAYRARVVIVSPSLLMLAIQVMQQILKDARMREAADLIRAEVSRMMEDVGRLQERVLKLQQHHGQAAEDMRQIIISSEKIGRRAGRIDALDFSDGEPANRPPAPLPLACGWRRASEVGPMLRAPSRVDAVADTVADQARFAETLSVYLRPRVLIVMFLGFSSGLPLALSGSTLLVWMREAGVDLATIGLFALVGTPYTVKFLWAPLVDALDVPVLSRLFGRRRAWLILSQLLLIAAIVFLALTNPAANPWLVAFGALLVATGVGDPGHRRRCLPGREPSGERAGGRHGLLRRRLPHRHAGLDRRRAVPGQRLRGAGPRQERAPGAPATSRSRRWSSSA